LTVSKIHQGILKNPSNPSDPPRSITWGKRMFKEMFLVYFEFVPVLEKSKTTYLFDPSMVINGNFDFNFYNHRKRKLSLTIKDFEEKESFSIFQKEVFSK